MRQDGATARPNTLLAPKRTRLHTAAENAFKPRTIVQRTKRAAMMSPRAWHALLIVGVNWNGVSAHSFTEARGMCRRR